MISVLCLNIAHNMMMMMIKNEFINANCFWFPFEMHWNWSDFDFVTQVFLTFIE